MSRLPEGTLSGHYTAQGIPAAADVWLVHELSHRPESMVPGKPNIEIAQRLEVAQSEKILPVFASLSIVRALEYMRSDVEITEVFTGPSAKGRSENTGTWGELQQSQEKMAIHGFARPGIITSGYNIGNIVIQANMLGLNPIVPEDLPRSFDPKSDQWWTRNRLYWTIAAKPRIRELRKSGH